jgi:hypothetical protein
MQIHHSLLGVEPTDINQNHSVALHASSPLTLARKPKKCGAIATRSAGLVAFLEILTLPPAVPIGIKRLADDAPTPIGFVSDFTRDFLLNRKCNLVKQVFKTTLFA